MAGAADIPAFRSMRTLRALRPLRAVSRWEGMRVSSAPRWKPNMLLNVQFINIKPLVFRITQHVDVFPILSFNLENFPSLFLLYDAP